MQKLLELLKARGFDCVPDFSGEVIRFDRNGKYQSAWFIGHDIGSTKWCSYGDWATGEKYEWNDIDTKQLEPGELKTLMKEIENKKAEQAAKREAGYKRAAETAEKMISNSRLDSHPYTKGKGFENSTFLVSNATDHLLVPIYNKDQLVSVQQIAPNGTKTFLPGGKLRGSYYEIPSPNKRERTGVVYICEGYATGLSIAQVARGPVLVAFNAGNIPALCANLPVPATKVVICADNDQWTNRPDGTPWNPGIEAAYNGVEVLNKLGIPTIVSAPNFDEKSLASKPTDWNDFHQLYGTARLGEALHLLPEFPAPEPKGDKSNQLPRPPTYPPQSEELPTELEPLPITTNKRGVPQPPSQEELAHALAKFYGDDLVRQGDDVWEWYGTHWVYQDQKEFKFRAKLELQVLGSGLMSNSNLDGAYQLFLGKLRTPPPNVNLFTQAPNATNFLDGSLHIIDDKLEFRTTNKQDYFTFVLPYKYLEKGDEQNDLLIKFLDRAFDGDPDKAGKIRCLKQAAGACLLPVYPHLFFLHGVPKSGKSTLALLFSKLVGDNNWASVEPKDMQGFQVEGLLNKLVNIETEISRTERIDDSFLKKIEDRKPMMINRKNRSIIYGYLPGVHIFCGNNLPRSLDGESQAYGRRASVIEFSKEISGGDTYRDYFLKIYAHNPNGLLNFALAGLKDLVASKGEYFVPESSKKAVEDWQKQSDTVGQFIDAIQAGEIGPEHAKLYLDPGARIRRTDLHLAYMAFMKQHNPGKYTLSAHSFYAAVERKGFRLKMIKGLRYVQGVGIIGGETVDPGSGF